MDIGERCALMNRRDFLKRCVGAAGGVALSACAPAGAAAVLSNKIIDLNIGAKRPNIVFIFIDDMGWTGTSYMGSEYYETPRIDKLSREGMVFTNAYTAAANCAPTRACLMSGQYTPRHGVFTVGSSTRDKPRERLVPIPNTTELDPAIVTIPEALKAAGYVSACIGKWHLGNNSPYSPADQGFDVSVARGDLDNDPDDPKDIYGLTAEAVKFVEANKDRPFFLYMAHHTVHTPVEARGELTAEYQDKPPSNGQDDPKYAAMTEHTDEGVGILLDKLDELGLVKNTIVIFYSDNGGAGHQTSNMPLRGAKGMLYEGGIRVPMIVRWPGVVRPGSTCSVPVITVDFYPTFLDIAGAPRPKELALDGVSIAPLLHGKKTLNRDALFWHCPVYLQGNYEGARDPYFRTRPVGAVRKGDWKLLQYFEELEFGDGDQVQLELYNLADDLGETNNLAEAMPEKTQEMLDLLVSWREQVNAPIPVEHNPEYAG